MMEDLLRELFSLAQQYSKETNNELVIKCVTGDEAKHFYYKARIPFNSKPFSVSNSTPVLVSNSTPVSKSESQKILRLAVLEQIRRDLKEPKLTRAPLSKLKVTGWPADIEYQLKEHSLKNTERLMKLLQKDKIHFERKK